MTPHPGVFQLKVWTAAVGATVGLAGMAFERRWLVWLAIGLLGVGFFLRLLDRKPPAP